MNLFCIDSAILLCRDHKMCVCCEYSWIAGTLRWKAVECNCIYVQSGGNGRTTMLAVGTKGKCFVFRAYAAFTNVAGKAITINHRGE